MTVYNDRLDFKFQIMFVCYTSKFETPKKKIPVLILHQNIYNQHSNSHGIITIHIWFLSARDMHE